MEIMSMDPQQRNPLSPLFQRGNRNPPPLKKSAIERCQKIERYKGMPQNGSHLFKENEP
jgi:hypothetical protein